DDGPGNGAVMDGLAKVDREQLVRRMREDFEKTMREVADAVNAAPDGHLIDGSEERVRDLLGEFRRRSFQTATQMRVEATEASAAFSPCEAGAGQPGGVGPLDAELQREGRASAAAVPEPRRHGGRGGRRADRSGRPRGESGDA